MNGDTKLEAKGPGGFGPEPSQSGPDASRWGRRTKAGRPDFESLAPE
jgi:hypothetical protein